MTKMNDLSKQCNSFFNWISDPKTHQLAEHLWKQSMLQTASNRFPELSFIELNKLLDRDWKYMGES